MKSRFFHQMGRFKGDEEGTVAIMFALLLLPIILLVGMAIDYASATNARAQAQEALDAALLAGVVGFNEGEDSDTIKARVNAVFVNNLP